MVTGQLVVQVSSIEEAVDEQMFGVGVTCEHLVQRGQEVSKKYECEISGRVIKNDIKSLLNLGELCEDKLLTVCLTEDLLESLVTRLLLTQLMD